MSATDHRKGSPAPALHRFPSITTLAAAAPLAAMPAVDQSWRGIAFHEAGHAVLMHLFRLRQNGAELTTVDGRVKGKVEVDFPPPEAAAVEVCLGELQVAALRIAAMYMAGIAAQMLKDALTVEGAILADAPDWRNAERALDYGEVPGSAIGRIYYCQRLAMAVLSRHWPAVVAIATALGQRGKLTAQEIATLCEGGALGYHA